MFYTKYRPQRFSEISKPNQTAEALLNQLKIGKTVHAYLFVGPRGTGKTTTARILAKALNCKNLQDTGDPCCECQNCLEIKNGSFIDLIEIDAASNRGIDDIRDLRDRVKLAPSLGKKKIYIIDEVHMLTNEAFNALLKTLEEPPKHVVFILCTTEFHKVPDTIKSRCQVFKFKRATLNQLVVKLTTIAKEEKAMISKDELQRIAVASLGGFRDAETLLQQVIEGEISVDALTVASSKQGFIDLVNNLLAHEINDAVRLVNKVYEDGNDLYIWSGELIRYLRDLLFISANAYEGLLDTTDDLFFNMEKQAHKIDTSQLVKLIEIFMRAQESIKGSFIPQLPLELAIVDYCTSFEDSSSGRKGRVLNPKPTVKPANSEKIAGIEDKVVDSKEKAENGSSKANETLDIEDSNELVDTQESVAQMDPPLVNVPIISLEEIQTKWENIMTKVAEYNHSIKALLKASIPLAVESSDLILEVSYKFHKERLETPKNRKLVEEVLKEVLQKDIHMKCLLGHGRVQVNSDRETGELTDMNVVVPAGDNLNKSVIDIFDGGLPL